jgi:hypothetical protein
MTKQRTSQEEWERRPVPVPTFEFENGAVLIALKPKPGDRRLYTVLCFWPMKNEYVVWTYNHADGGLYTGHYTERFEVAFQIYDSKA